MEIHQNGQLFTTELDSQLANVNHRAKLIFIRVLLSTLSPIVSNVMNLNKRLQINHH
jgi:hypothetical protein